MNAPENIATINAAHSVLLNAKDALSVTQVAQAIGASKPTASKQLKELYGLGLIESEPRAGGTPFYRLIAEPKADAGIPASEDIPTKTYPPAVLRALAGDLDSAAPEEYEMPPADKARLLAMANLELSGKIESLEAQVAELQESVERERRIGGAINRDLAKLTDLLGCDPCYNGPSEAISAINTLRADAEKSRTALNHAINEADRLRLELFEATKMKAPAVGYLVKAPKLKPRRVTKPEQAQAAALAAVRNGAARADVLALVPVGTAKRGAEWQGIQPMAKGD